MPAKVLIGYATKCGSTVEVAQAIGETLTQQGIEVDIRPMRKIKSLAGCDAVILGSAIRMGSWLGEASNFVKRHQAELQALPVAIFTVHMLNADDSPESAAARAAYTAPIHALITPAAEAFFTGKIELASMSFLDRMISNAMQAADQDLRDWEAIAGWAGQVGSVLTPA